MAAFRARGAAFQSLADHVDRVTMRVVKRQLARGIVARKEAAAMERKMKSEVEFVRQLGFRAEDDDNSLFVPLMFQPRSVATVVAIGILTQSAWVFLALGAALWWSTVVPRRNLFDAIYNAAIAGATGRRVPRETPAPRRFAQGMAGTASLTIGLALAGGVPLVAYVFQGLIAIGSSIVVFGRRCAPAAVYHVVRRRLLEYCAASADHGGVDRSQPRASGAGSRAS
jgi:hypothetical protein